MGSGIAQVLAQAGHKVVLYDTQTAALERAEIAIKNAFTKLAEKGKITEEQSTTYLSGLHYSSSLDDLSGSELVIEAIVEDLAIKQQVFRDLEERVNENCVLATNTSSLSLASIAAACKKPERVIGIHFFNPAPVMALVEIIPAVQTREGLAEQVRDWVQSWGKLPVITKDTPGFIVNRVARPFYSEAIRLLEEGVADCATIDAAMTDIGFKMGPFALMDFIGHDVNYRVTESVWQALYFDPRFKPALSQKRLFEAGFFGRKAGRGFYRYADNMPAPAPQEDPQLRNEIAQRILVMLINEAADAYFLNIASREDLETAMTRGVNYPKGLLAWGDEIGWKNILQRMGALYHYYQEDRYRVSPQVRLWAKD